MTSDKTKKSLVIKPFKPRNTMDAAAAAGIWGNLSRAIDEIHNKNASELSYEELYRNAYNLVLHKHGELLYANVRESLRAHLTRVARAAACVPDEQLLGELSARWADHQVTMVMIRDILMYMDRTYVKQMNRMLVYDLGLQIFRDAIVRHDKVRDRLRALLLRNVAEERAGRLIDRGLMKTILGMLVDVSVDGPSVYEKEFEAPFLEATARFYRAESLGFIAANTCPDYMRKVEARLAEEAARGTQYLHVGTVPKLNAIVETALIQDHARTLVDTEHSGCESMFRENKIEDLERMYTLFQRVPSTVDDLRGAMCDFVKRSGKALLADQEVAGREPVAFVQGLLELRDKFTGIVEHAFHNDQKAAKRLKEAFEDFVNADNRSARFLASYADDLLRSGLRGVPEHEVDRQLEKVIVIFRYLQDKDIFENFHKIHLSKRLLTGRSISNDYERNMIARLKAECGYQFTSKLEGMFTDMRISQDAMEGYRRAGLSHSYGVELEVSMLTGGYWPTQTVDACVLPAPLKQCCDTFEKHYLEKHTGRKIVWQTHMGSADLKAVFGGRRHELNVSTYQMCILMLFNQTDQLSLTIIRNHVNIPDQELRRHLISLCTPKHRILKKTSKGKGIADDDVFIFNEEFTSKLKRVRVPLVSARDLGLGPDAADGGGGGGGADDVPFNVQRDRQNMVEAAIVRIMKARKALGHNALVAEVTKQLQNRFNPAPVFIKKRIEALIERDYLQRDEKDRRTYVYLA
ncbi:Cullin [Tribonema minus]|uniref:Cullin n=1 Tax=Tribonema minus TaxID=303371 RepID=A0A835Z7J2_9STRA|nr:Cullin [Tribonema minus]